MDADQRNRKHNAASTVLSLWMSLLAFQAIRFLGFMLVLRTDAIVSYIVLMVGAVLYLEWHIFGWIVKQHGFQPAVDSPFALVDYPAAKGSWNPLHWKLHSVLSPVCFLLVVIPALWFVVFVEPGRLFRDGPTIGPVSLAELTMPTTAGVILFKDGHVHHASGGGVEYKMTRSVTKRFYADPFGDDLWDSSQPVKVWVIHQDDEVITPAHRYAYVVNRHNMHRSAYQKALQNSEQRFQINSADDAIMVRLDTRPPFWLQGPSYWGVLVLIYASAGLYVGTYAYRLVYSRA